MPVTRASCVQDRGNRTQDHRQKLDDAVQGKNWQLEGERAPDHSDRRLADACDSPGHQAEAVDAVRRMPAKGRGSAVCRRAAVLAEGSLDRGEASAEVGLEARKAPDQGPGTWSAHRRSAPLAACSLGVGRRCVRARRRVRWPRPV